MAIYDNDGTSSCEIGKLYDNDGTTSVQIGKVYDNDGTVSSLIYTAEEQLYPDGGYTPASNSSSMNGGSASGFKITLSGTSNKNANRYIAPVDLSQYSAITVAYTTSGVNGTASYPTVAIVTSAGFYAVCLCGTDNPYSDYAFVLSGCHKRIKANESGSVTFDVSGLTNSAAYIWIGLWQNTAGSGGGTIEVTSVIAE